MIAVWDSIVWNKVFVSFFFSLAEFKILTLSLILNNFIVMCLREVSCWSNLYGVLCFSVPEIPYLSPAFRNIWPLAQRVKRLPAMRETRVPSLGWEDPLEKEMATHSSTVAWKIPWMEESGRPQSTGSQRVRHD